MFRTPPGLLGFTIKCLTTTQYVPRHLSSTSWIQNVMHMNTTEFVEDPPPPIKKPLNGCNR